MVGRGAAKIVSNASQIIWGRIKSINTKLSCVKLGIATYICFKYVPTTKHVQGMDIDSSHAVFRVVITILPQHNSFPFTLINNTYKHIRISLNNKNSFDFQFKKFFKI